MTIGEPSEILEIEAKLVLQPDSRSLRERLLVARASEASGASSSVRVETILWFVEHEPGHLIARTPFVAISPEADPLAFARVKTAWLDRIDRTPSDSGVLCGAALFIARASTPDGRDLLLRAAALSPGDASIAINLGVIGATPMERFTHFARARQLGSTHQNLPVWLALAAAEAGAPEAFLLAQELLDAATADEAVIGAAITWRESGRELWLKARATSQSDADARTLTGAITRRSYYKHWAHTVLGLIAAGRHQWEEAVSHLRHSREIQHDFRLDAYGPSQHLLIALCRQGLFEAVEEFLRAWLSFSDNERAKGWLARVQRREVPEDEAG